MTFVVVMKKTDYSRVEAIVEWQFSLRKLIEI